MNISLWNQLLSIWFDENSSRIQWETTHCLLSHKIELIELRLWNVDDWTQGYWCVCLEIHNSFRWVQMFRDVQKNFSENFSKAWYRKTFEFLAYLSNDRPGLKSFGPGPARQARLVRDMGFLRKIFKFFFQFSIFHAEKLTKRHSYYSMRKVWVHLSTP